MPPIADVTGTMIVQPPAGIVAPLLYVMVEPAGATTTFAAAQVPVRVGGVPRTRLAGSVSTKSAFSVSATAFVFPSVSRSEEFAPSGIVEGTNVFATVGSARTVRVAVAATVLLPTVV